MTDYQPLIARAIEGLGKSTGEARRALYERARSALVTQLRSVEPALSESEITRERLSLEEAIRKVEADAARKSRMEARTEPRFEPRPLKPPSRPAPAAMPAAAPPPPPPAAAPQPPAPRAAEPPQPQAFEAAPGRAAAAAGRFRRAGASRTAAPAPAATAYAVHGARPAVKRARAFAWPGRTQGLPRRRARRRRSRLRQRPRGPIGARHPRHLRTAAAPLAARRRYAAGAVRA